MKWSKKLAPKNINHRRYTKWIFWMLLIFLILGSIRAFSATARINALEKQPEKEQQQEQIVNYATSIGAQNFAKNFISEYFKWNNGDYKERVDRLKPYLREGLDEEAGLKSDTLTGSSWTEKTELLEVSETGKNTALLTFKVSQKVKLMTKTNIKGKVREVEKESGPYDKWIQVPVITKGKSFLINGIPTFTSKPLEAKIEPIEPSKAASMVDSKASAEIKEFLKTFYKQYSTGTMAELEYLTSDKDLRPLEGTIIFNQIEDLIILEKKKKSYIVEVNAVFTDKNTKTQLLQKHNLEVSKQNGAWKVIKFN